MSTAPTAAALTAKQPRPRTRTSSSTIQRTWSAPDNSGACHQALRAHHSERCTLDTLAVRYGRGAEHAAGRFPAESRQSTVWLCSAGLLHVSWQGCGARMWTMSPSWPLRRTKRSSASRLLPASPSVCARTARTAIATPPAARLCSDRRVLCVYMGAHAQCSLPAAGSALAGSGRTKDQLMGYNAGGNNHRTQDRPDADVGMDLQTTRASSTTMWWLALRVSPQLWATVCNSTINALVLF